MKKLIVALVICSSLHACKGGVKVDEKDFETAGKELQHAVKKGVDTAGAKLKELKNKLDSNRRDTIVKDTVVIQK
jgi:predicted small secreted protein